MKNKGFTLVELLAVIAILAILVIIALPNVLKMFNDSKKNSFLTEAKTLYSEVSKKYISETMKGNKLTYISSEDDTKLEMTGRDLQYCVLLNTDGSVKSMKVSNGEWIAELPSGKKITDLKNADLKDGNLNDYDCYNPFRDDSWETIASNVKTGNTRYGIQNLSYDKHSGDYYTFVYKGSKSNYPNYDLFVIDGKKKPVKKRVELYGREEEWDVLTLANKGIKDKSGINGWYFDYGSTGVAPLGDGRFYISHHYRDSSGGHGTTIRTYRWTGDEAVPFKLIEQ